MHSRYISIIGSFDTDGKIYAKTAVHIIKNSGYLCIYVAQ